MGEPFLPLSQLKYRYPLRMTGCDQGNERPSQTNHQPTHNNPSIVLKPRIQHSELGRWPRQNRMAAGRRALQVVAVEAAVEQLVDVERLPHRRSEVSHVTARGHSLTRFGACRVESTDEVVKTEAPKATGWIDRLQHCWGICGQFRHGCAGGANTGSVSFAEMLKKQKETQAVAKAPGKECCSVAFANFT